MRTGGDNWIESRRGRRLRRWPGWRIGCLAVLAAAVCCAGCGPAAPEPVRLDLAGIEPSADVSDWAAVLDQAVLDDGRFDPDALRGVSDRLDRYLRPLAVAGPTATPGLYPTAGDRLAYWYNARAAWSLKLAALADFPTLPGAAVFDRPFPLDGRRMTLAGIDAVLIDYARLCGDFRLAVAAPGATLQYAPLSRRPYTAEWFQTDLPVAAVLLDERRFRLDVYRQEAQVPPMLWAVRGMVVDQYLRRFGVCDVGLLTALRWQVSPEVRHRLDRAMGYRVVPRTTAPLAAPGRTVYWPGKLRPVEVE